MTRAGLVWLIGLAACGPVLVGANDNRRAAGTVVELEITEGLWRPERTMPAVKVRAFGLPGAAGSIPGPIIRVEQGARVEVTLRNRLAVPVTVHGFGERPDPGEVVVAAGAATHVQFRAVAAGTFYYWGNGALPGKREAADSQLVGALIVDAPGAARDDRVFVLNHYLDPDNEFWVINGRSWPDTERLSYTVGDEVRWRWINASDEDHPLHLHGTHFRVVSAGDNVRDVPRPPAEQTLEFTRSVPTAGTAGIVWSPSRAGRWLFHCHILLHVIPELRMAKGWYPDYAALPHGQHMAGLVMGIEARPRTGAPAPAPAESAAPRRLTLRVGERAGVRYHIPDGDFPGLGYGLGEGTEVSAPGPTLVITRGEPVEITVVNGLARTTSVHWHGIELDSYYDGVPHFGGDARRTTPWIDAGGTFVARFAPPRAGTFMYHTHFNDFIQLSSGLYGALIVSDADHPYDPATDLVLVLGRDGPDDKKAAGLINGATHPAPLALRAGRTYRLRLVGIAPAHAAHVRVLRGEQPVTWRALAKDAVDLPAALATARPADVTVAVGETYDFELTPEAGALRVEANFGAGEPAWLTLDVAP